MKALLMVGGEGRRLRPLTSHTPKSLLKIGEQTILDRTLLLLRHYGITEVTLAVRYLASQIEDHVRCGSHLGVSASYVKETAPLGTAGALSLVDDFDDTMLMMNGDILTDIDIRSMLERHYSLGAAMTVASKVMYTDLSLGVLDTREDGLIQAYQEKPRIAHRFGIGIYVMEPRVKANISRGDYLDAPDLIGRLIAAGDKVAFFDHPGQWIDIGLPEDYARVQNMHEVALSKPHSA